VTLACAACATVILVVYLVRRPERTQSIKVWLLLGIGVFPLGVALPGNIEGFEATKQRTFCGSCHVMGPYQADVENAASASLSSRHSRNKLFGEHSCYTCHADYGMYGTVATKLGGMGHVWRYATEYRNVSLEEARKTIHLRRPYPNENCMQCHSTENAGWTKRGDHKASLDDVRSGKVSCASNGCHGYAHPFSKPPPAASSSGVVP
jgi:cytochrome c-type protein NapC